MTPFEILTLVAGLGAAGLVVGLIVTDRQLKALEREIEARRVEREAAE